MVKDVFVLNDNMLLVTKENLSTNLFSKMMVKKYGR